MKHLMVVAEEWPHGLRCMDCNEKLTNGSVYSKRLVGMNGDAPVVEIVCVICGFREMLGADPPRERPAES